MTPEEMLKTAQTLRDAGVLIFERRCWDDETFLSNYDGKMYRRVNGCGSYFRWALGEMCSCPFCGHTYDYSQKFPYTDPKLYPLTSNYTGNMHVMTPEEVEMRTSSTNGWVVDGHLEKEMSGE